jgi:hypothetical protein
MRYDNDYWKPSENVQCRMRELYRKLNRGDRREIDRMEHWIVQSRCLLHNEKWEGISGIYFGEQGVCERVVRDVARSKRRHFVDLVEDAGSKISGKGDNFGKSDVLYYNVLKEEVDKRKGLFRQGFWRWLTMMERERYKYRPDKEIVAEVG